MPAIIALCAVVVGLIVLVVLLHNTAYLRSQDCDRLETESAELKRRLTVEHARLVTETTLSDNIRIAAVAERAKDREARCESERRLSNKIAYVEEERDCNLAAWNTATEERDEALEHVSQLEAACAAAQQKAGQYDRAVSDTKRVMDELDSAQEALAVVRQERNAAMVAYRNNVRQAKLNNRTMIQTIP